MNNEPMHFPSIVHTRLTIEQKKAIPATEFKLTRKKRVQIRFQMTTKLMPVYILDLRLYMLRYKLLNLIEKNTNSTFHL